MLSDAIRRWNPWWVKGRLSSELTGVKREKTEEVIRSLNTSLIKGIIGPRRSGKTTLLYQIIEHLIRHGTDPKNILMLNFDDNSIYATDFETLLTECRKINPHITHVFLDEVQERTGWERWVRTLYDTRQFSQIFVTGSSSSLLKEDVSRVLTGRHLTFHMLPFSFREYLTSLPGWGALTTDRMESQKGEILHYMHRYLRNGGYPETLGMDDTLRNRYLNEMFDDIIARDITARYGAEYSIARRIAYYLTSNASCTMTRRSLASACGVAVDTVSKYLNYLHESGLIYPLRPFSYKLREQMREINKYYTVDTGLAAAVSFRFTENMGRAIENLVYLELLRRSQDRQDMDIYYWKDSTGKEIDFLIKKGMEVTQLIQVCWDIDEKKTKKREITALLRGMNEFAIHEGTVITENYEETEIIEGKRILYIPLWKWLLKRYS